jgi:hypothetical protein
MSSLSTVKRPGGNQKVAGRLALKVREKKKRVALSAVSTGGIVPGLSGALSLSLFLFFSST